MKRELSNEDAEDPDDIGRCVAWLDGELEGAERDRFELRLAAEPDLAAAVEELAKADAWMRRLESSAKAEVVRSARIKPWVWAGSLALAAAVLIAVAANLLQPSTRSRSIEVAVLPSFESASELVASVPELEGLRPPGLDVLRGAGEPPNVGAAEFAAKAAEAERAQADRAFESKQLETTAGFFVIPLELDAPSRVLVWAYPRNGSVLFLHPAGGRESTLAAGRHVLPEERFQVVDGASPRVAYERGYLVPIGAEELDLVVAIEPRPTDPIEDASWGRAANADELQSELERKGWTVRRLRVREPQD